MLASEIRARIVALCRDLSRRGFLAATGGNVAIRVDEACFAVTPSAVDYAVLRPQDVCIVRLSDQARIDGDLRPSVETGLHAQVLARRPEVACSIHTHQPAASALALIGEAVAVDDAELLALLGPELPVVGYMPSGTSLLAKKLGRALRANTNAYLLANHGVVCCGPSVEAAVAAVEGLETLARRLLERRIAERASKDEADAPSLRRLLLTIDTR
jgi:L-fuculose-phosphate aldolase